MDIRVARVELRQFAVSLRRSFVVVVNKGCNRVGLIAFPERKTRRLGELLSFGDGDLRFILIAGVELVN